MRVAVITLSDKGYKNEREDISGELIKEMMRQSGAEIVHYALLPDELSMIYDELVRLADGGICDLILTTGGTGFSPRDVTPEATLMAVERQAPGLAEAMRLKSLSITPHAMLSRAAAGIRKKTLIINLPGSPKAVKECLETVMPALGHAIKIMGGNTGDCAS